MQKILVIIGLLFAYCYARAQYRYDNRYYAHDLKIGADEFPYDKTSFKRYNNGFRVYRKYDSGKRTKLVISDIDRATFLTKSKDTIDVPKDLSFITDCLATNKYDVVMGIKRLLVFNRNTKATKYTHWDTLSCRNVLPVDDSTAIAYMYSDYHPMNGFSGFEMHLINLNNSQVVRSYKTRMNGIALSHMTVNWAVTAGKYIYTVYPLSGELIKYDLQFQIIDRRRLPVKWGNYAKNLAYQHKTDSLIYSEYDRVKKLYEQLGEDSGKLSLIYTKDFVADVSETVRKEYDFIEKVLPLNDSVIIFTLSRPGYALKYRDLLFYNTNSNKITRSISHWACDRQDVQTKFEDFFPIDIINDAPTAPIFIKDKIYFGTIYNVDLYRRGNTDTLKKIMMKDVAVNNYTWKLLEYSY